MRYVSVVTSVLFTLAIGIAVFLLAFPRAAAPSLAWLHREVLRDGTDTVYESAEVVGEFRGIRYQVLSYYGGIPDSDMAWDTTFRVTGTSPVVAGGVWNGPLPEEGTSVRIVSPTGQAEDVVVVDQETGEVYRSAGTLSRPPSRLFVTRYVDPDTERVIAVCAAVARSRQMAEQGMYCDFSGDRLVTERDVFDRSGGTLWIIPIEPEGY